MYLYIIVLVSEDGWWLNVLPLQSCAICTPLHKLLWMTILEQSQADGGGVGGGGYSNVPTETGTMWTQVIGTTDRMTSSSKFNRNW
jgi:hypothetical protein